MKNKYYFFLQRFLRDVTRPLGFEIADDLHGKELKEYYFLFYEDKIVNQKGGTKSFELDEKGIPRNPTYIDVKDQDYVYFPITIGQYGLAVFHSFLRTQADIDKRRFMTIADWFYNNAQVDEKSGTRWLTAVPLPQYKNKGPWQSAFAQSRGLSVLLRAYQLTGEKKYAKCAEQALLPFTISIADGGVTAFTEWGPFYEEYTSSVPTLVLNGMVFALCGLYDFVRVFPENARAHKIFNEGIITLENILPQYDLGFWSRYNLCRADWHPEIDPATITYHRLHIRQLEMLYHLTKKLIFQTYADKFKEQDIWLNRIRMYKMKYRSLKKIGRL